MLGWRNLVCGAMIVVLPTSLMAQDSARAILRTNGGTWLNGKPAPSSSAIFPNDAVQTQKLSSATIDAEGSQATIQAETMVQFDGDELVLDHGSLQVRTSRGMKVRVNCITIIPITQGLTRYAVTDVDGEVGVASYESDVRIHYRGAGAGKSRMSEPELIVHGGEQKTREERCGAAAKPASPLDARGAILNNPWVQGTGIAAVGVPICWALCEWGADPVSPSKP